MLLVIGTQLGCPLHFWDPDNSEYYLPEVRAVMVSYADFYGHPVRRQQAMEVGLRRYLRAPEHVQVWLDNGAFGFWKKGIEPPVSEYVEFVDNVKPDWYPVPADFIPHPDLSRKEQEGLFRKTMEMNQRYAPRGYVPVLHAGDWLEDYVEEIADLDIDIRVGVALGGLVPRLLKTKGAPSREKIVDTIRVVRQELSEYPLHVYGIGGLTTLHLAYVLNVDSIDSAGWRNRAARGLIFVPGKGERSVVPLGNWRGKEISREDLEVLQRCECPACIKHGLTGLRAHKGSRGMNTGAWGFRSRGVHNMWTFIREADAIERHIANGDYASWYRSHVRSATFLKLIEYCLNRSGGEA